MSIPIKTSNDQWLGMTRELYYQRINIILEDDANYLTENLNLLKEFRGLTLTIESLRNLSALYMFALISIILGYLSLSLTYGSVFVLVFTSISTIVCLFIPTRQILKNKSPNISATDSGFEITFDRKAT